MTVQCSGTLAVNKFSLVLCCQMSGELLLAVQLESVVNLGMEAGVKQRLTTCPHYSRVPSKTFTTFKKNDQKSDLQLLYEFMPAWF